MLEFKTQEEIYDELIHKLPKTWLVSSVQLKDMIKSLKYQCLDSFHNMLCFNNSIIFFRQELAFGHSCKDLIGNLFHSRIK